MVVLINHIVNTFTCYAHSFCSHLPIIMEIIGRTVHLMISGQSITTLIKIIPLAGKLFPTFLQLPLRIKILSAAVVLTPLIFTLAIGIKTLHILSHNLTFKNPGSGIIDIISVYLSGHIHPAIFIKTIAFRHTILVSVQPHPAIGRIRTVIISIPPIRNSILIRRSILILDPFPCKCRHCHS